LRCVAFDASCVPYLVGLRLEPAAERRFSSAFTGVMVTKSLLRTISNFHHEVDFMRLCFPTGVRIVGSRLAVAAADWTAGALAQIVSSELVMEVRKAGSDAPFPLKFVDREAIGLLQNRCEPGVVPGSSQIGNVGFADSAKFAVMFLDAAIGRDV